jgi:HPr kinase/phosphorylase
MRALVVSRDARLDGLQAWTSAKIRIDVDDRPAHDIVDALRAGIAGRLARRVTVHGVMLDVHGVGLLVSGAAGAGKSTLALDLVARGHALVADDAVEIRRPAPGLLTGHCPPLLAGYLEARGLGVLDVRAMHGAASVRRHRRLDLIVQLRPGRLRAATARERLQGRRGTRRILGEKVPVLSLPARLGHNLAPLVEAACLDQRLRQEGADAAQALSRRQSRRIKRTVKHA